ncbi:unnamed protein product [Protopolystoma xenopodis]|uniref:CCR4-NOT transcription complex subunit 9 n=1 Tax=Protopolystoma xenopodis TaxID=117903 RepID=A0A3S5AMF5_9PLAT|nr:unnamed protein product [Protopolystoma xenopodis]
MQKMLLDNCGLAYICQTYQRFAHVATVLEKMVFQLAQEPSLRLLKHVIRCYLRLSDHQKARETLKTCLPTHLSDDTFSSILEQDMATKRWLTQLLRHLQITPAPSTVIDGNPISSSASSVSTVVGSASSTGVAADIVGVRGSTDSMDASGSGGVSITALGNPASSESSDVINNSGSAGNAGQAGPVGSLVICTSSGSGSMSQRLHLSTSASTVTSLASAVSGGSK